MDNLTKEERWRKFFDEHYELKEKIESKIQKETKVKFEKENKVSKRSEIYNRITKLREKGKTQQEIGEILGVTRQRIQQIEIKMGITRRENARIYILCKGCGKKLAVTQNKLDTGNGFYCSTLCSDLVILQRRITLNEKWKDTCQICHRKNKSHMLTYRRKNRFICRQCNTKIAREYRKTKKGKEAYRKLAKKMSEKFPEKQKARAQVAYALKRGQLKKPKKCSRCKKQKKLDGHHSDYSKPLEVKWLCRGCHADIHHEEKLTNAR